MSAASRHTETMLTFWQRIGIVEADLAVRRCDGAMIWHHQLPLLRLPLAWARAENCRGADVYVRPARGQRWGVVLLDDVECVLARRILGKYAGVAVRTSRAGGCHLWLHSDVALDEGERHRAQAWLAGRCGADLGSTSGEHLGRLAGFKNWKRGGEWVNVIAVASPSRPAWSTAAIADTPAPASRPTAGKPRQHRDIDRSPSGRDWAWVCQQLERGASAGQVQRQLENDAAPRRSGDAPRYAQRTVQQAVLHLRGGNNNRPQPAPSCTEAGSGMDPLGSMPDPRLEIPEGGVEITGLTGPAHRERDQLPHAHSTTKGGDPGAGADGEF